MKGKLIVIDGTDGSGKATQVALLKERLVNEGKSVESLDFPRYQDNFFGKFIGECLTGKHGDWAGLNPKIASVVYAADRFESSAQIRDWLEDGVIVILDRYVSSNQIHQGGKIDDEEERREFMQWLDTMEHEAFGSPRPDVILYLDVPIAVSQKLLQEKTAQDKKDYQGDMKGDQHENNLEHLEAARESGLKMIAEGNNWLRIVCTEDDSLRSIDDIHQEIHTKLLPYIAE